MIAKIRSTNSPSSASLGSAITNRTSDVGFTGFKLGFIYALIGTIASEFILAENGLGWLIAYNYNNFDIQGMFAAMLLVILLALFVNAVLAAVENRLYRRIRT